MFCQLFYVFIHVIILTTCFATHLLQVILRKAVRDWGSSTHQVTHWHQHRPPAPEVAPRKAGTYRNNSLDSDTKVTKETWVLCSILKTE